MPNTLTQINPVNNDGPQVRGITDTINPTNATGIFFDLTLFRSGSFLLPNGQNTSWSWYASPTKDGTYTLIEAAGSSGVQTAVAAKWNAIPAAVFAHRYVKVVPGADVTGACFSFLSN